MYIIEEKLLTSVLILFKNIIAVILRYYTPVHQYYENLFDVRYPV